MNKTFKKTFSIVLSLFMLIGIIPMMTFTAEAASEDVYFYVPEALYITPTDNGGNQPVKYFLNSYRSESTQSWASPYEDSGKLYFYCPAATSVSLSVSDASVFNLTTSGTNKIDDDSFSMTAPNSSGSIVTWTATYTVNGETRTATSYSYVYSPNRVPTGVASEAESDKHGSGKYDYHGIVSVIWGANTYDEGDTIGNQSAQGPASMIYLGNNGMKSAGNTRPHNVGYFDKTHPKTFRYHNNDNKNPTVESPAANFFVDVSRFGNMNQIPYMAFGLAVTDDQHTDGYELTTTLQNRETGVDISTLHSRTEYSTEVVVYNENDQKRPNCNISGISLSSWTHYRLYTYGRTWCGGTYTHSKQYINMDFIGSNKSNLRNAYLNAIKAGRKSSNYTSASWTTYQNALKNAANVLGNPISRTNSVDNAVNTLNNAINALETTVYFNGNGGFATAASKTFVIGANSSVTVNVSDVSAYRDYYQFKGWSKNANAENGENQFSLSWNETLYAAWLANTYLVTVATGNGYTLSEDRKIVPYNGSFTFTLTLDSEHSQSEPVIKCGSTSLVGNRSGNTITYTVSNVSTDMDFTVSGINKNKYEVKVIADEGAVVGGALATINHGGEHEFTVTLKEAYSQNVPSVTAGDTTITPTSVSGNIYKYKVTNITAPVTVHVTTRLNKYTVSFTGGEGYEFNKGDTVVNHGDNLEFNLTLKEGYTQSAPKVYAGGVELKATVNGNVYSYDLTGISSDKTVTVEGVRKNTYKVTLPAPQTGAWFAQSSFGYDEASITHGEDYCFAVTVNEAYSRTVPAVKAYGETLTAVSINELADGSTVYAYRIENIIADGVVTVNEMEKNKYSVVLPEGLGYTVSYDSSVFDLNSITHGTPFQFTIALEEQFNRSNPEVYLNGRLVEPAEGGLYTITVTEDIGAGELEVRNVKLNDYYIALALDSEMGYTIEVKDGYNPKKVQSGSDFMFRLFLDPAYSKSTPVVKLSKNGGDSYTIMGKDANGYYIIDEVLTDCIVVVENVVVNTYNVVYTDHLGNEIYAKTVEYGEDAPFEGEEPSRPEEIVNTSTVITNASDPKVEVVTTVKRVYTFAGWSQEAKNVTKDMTIRPIFDAANVSETLTYVDGVVSGDPTVVKENAYASVIFFDDNGTILYQENVIKGQPFAGCPVEPAKASSNPYGTYSFAGWDTNNDGEVDIPAGSSTAIENVSEGRVYVAVYNYSLGSQTVRFFNYDGRELLYHTKVNRGETAVYGNASIPSRRDEQNTYTFAGWSYETYADSSSVIDKIVVGESNINVYAAYDAEPIVYTYRYISEGEVLKEGTFRFNEFYKYFDDEHTTLPEKAPTVASAYVFKEWKSEQKEYVSTHTAIFTESAREYAVKFILSDGLTVTGLRTAAYGTEYVFTVTADASCNKKAPVVKDELGNTLVPSSVSGSTFTYTVSVEGDTAEYIEKLLTFTATAERNMYHVEFFNDEKSVYTTYVVHGGSVTYPYETPSKEADDFYFYTFAGWSHSGENITGDTDIFARYDATYIHKCSFDRKLYTIHPANCMNNEVAMFACTCGNTMPLEVPDSTDKENHVGPISVIGFVNATCEGDGYTGDKICDYCKETVKKGTVILATGHIWTDWEIENASTCTVKGNEVRHCTKCDTEQRRDIDLVSHVSAGPATCTKPEVCANCGFVLADALGHDFGEWVVVREVILGNPGLKERYCSRCDAKEQLEYNDVNENNPGTGVRFVKFINIDKMEYKVDDGEGGSYTVYNSAMLQWYEDKPLYFTVYTYSNFKYPTIIVKVNGVKIEPDANGVYTVPAGTDLAVVTVEGAVKDGDGTKLSFWEMLLRFFKKIIAFFGKIFGGSSGGSDGSHS